MSAEALPQQKTSRARKIGEIIREEAVNFAVIFVYLALVFGVLSLHQWIVLSADGIYFRFYGVALLNALVLGKVILIAESFHFGERFKGRPLVYPVLYKSLTFTALLIAFYIAEEVIVGAFHGKSLTDAFPKIGDGSVGNWFAMALILTICLMPFFAFREMTSVIGRQHLEALWLTGKLKPTPAPRQGVSSNLTEPAR